jgi:cysteine-rich repeat protein
MRRAFAFLLASTTLAVGPSCGGPATEPDAAGGEDAGLDAGPPDAGHDGGPPDAGAVCGDGVREGGEACDDGNRRGDDGCSAACAIECGDGRVSGEELCDVAIASGEGACPSACDDGMACTTDTLVGSGCLASCSSIEITTPRDGDDCCPGGASSLVDRDCAVVCGNGLVEAGEICDTAIGAEPGACATVCDDGIVCTADALVDPGTCTAACTFTEITAAADGDGCCPPGATVASDADCSPFCGDGVLTPGEACDTAIASGAGACPSACDDAEVCTRDALVAGGTCSAVCTHTALGPMPGDLCCPAGATIATDADCPVRCGDGVPSAGEACDDGNVLSGDGCGPTCAREPLTFRFTTFQFQDPRLFNGSLDVTPEVNTAIRNALTSDVGPMDGIVDLSLIVRFDPLDQSAASVPGLAGFAECTMPLDASTCRPNGVADVMIVNQSTGTCLAPLPGTIPPERVVNAPSAPCFRASFPGTLDIRVGPVLVRLRDVEIGAQYLGDPARRLVTGLLRGFLTEADALTARFDERNLTEILRASDRDDLGGMPGWWLYIAFTGDPVGYTP